MYSLISLTLVSDYSLKVVYKVKKRYPIFQTKVLDPYPHSNGGQHLGALVACPFLPLYIFAWHFTSLIRSFSPASQQINTSKKRKKKFFKIHFKNSLVDNPLSNQSFPKAVFLGGMHQGPTLLEIEANQIKVIVMTNTNLCCRFT